MGIWDERYAVLVLNYPREDTQPNIEISFLQNKH